MCSPHAPWLLGVVLTLSNAVPQRRIESCLGGNCGRHFMHAGAPYTGRRRLEGPQGLSRHYALLQHTSLVARVGQQQAPAYGSTKASLLGFRSITLPARVIYCSFGKIAAAKGFAAHEVQRQAAHHFFVHNTVSSQKSSALRAWSSSASQFLRLRLVVRGIVASTKGVLTRCAEHQRATLGSQGRSMRTTRIPANLYTVASRSRTSREEASSPSSTVTAEASLLPL